MKFKLNLRSPRLPILGALTVLLASVLVTLLAARQRRGPAVAPDPAAANESRVPEVTGALSAAPAAMHALPVPMGLSLVSEERPLIVGIAVPDIVRPEDIVEGDALAVHLGLWRCVEAAAARLGFPSGSGRFPTLVTPLRPDGAVDQQLAELDVVVVGGQRLTNQGFPTGWLKEILRGALHLGKPTGGICFGHQLLAQVIARKGVLSDLDDAHGGFHAPVTTPLFVREHSLAHVAGLTEGVCAHGQGVSAAAIGDTAIEVTAYAAGAPQGERTVEALEVREARAFSVQCHPEELGDRGIEWIWRILAMGRDLRLGCLGQTSDTAWLDRPYGRLLPPPTDPAAAN